MTWIWFSLISAITAVLMIGYKFSIGFVRNSNFYLDMIAAAGLRKRRLAF